ncbi:MAG: hypothetical protein HOI47_23235 [Candidatus Scalindua sp.]|jgi:hypothetical protein|nr:hypothetical protein [Candidatus Scalindua sp.]
MFSFKYMFINIVVGFVAGMIGNKGSEVFAWVIVAGSALVTISTFGFGWGIAAIVEMVIGMAIYGALGAK